MEAIVALAERLGAPVLTTFKAKGQISDAPPARRRRARPQRHARRELCMNESDLLVVLGRIVLEPHRDRPVQADHPGRRRPDGARSLPPGRPSRARATSASPRRGSSASAARRRSQRSTSAPTSRSAGRSGAPRSRSRIGRRSRTRRRLGGGVRRAWTRVSRRRRGVRRRRQQHLLVRPVLRVSTRQSVLMSGYLGSIGFGLPAAMGAWAAAGDRASDRRGRPATAGSASTSRSSPRR